MRVVKSSVITQTVRDLCIDTNIQMPKDLEKKIIDSQKQEENELGREILADLCENMTAARDMNLPICQDTGMAVILADVGQEIYIDGDFEAAIHAGVKAGYTEGLLRASVVGDPLRRENTGDNTPAIIHTRLVPGDQMKLTVAPKGFGSENMSALKMMNPSAQKKDIIKFVTNTVVSAGSNPCPPVVVGVGIGGDFEFCALLAKRALCRSVSAENPDPYYREMEKEMLIALNQTGIGPQGFGGRVTALRVMIEVYPTHIAGLPVAVNMGCHVTRHKSCII